MNVSARLRPEGSDIATFADVVFAYTEGYVPVRLLPEKGAPDGKPWVEFVPADAGFFEHLAAAAGRAAEAGRGLFVVPGTVAAPGRARARDIVEMAVLVVDLDAGDISGKRDHLVRHFGEPTLEVASGGQTEAGETKLHLYWRLTEAATGEDLQRVAALRREIAAKAGGDPAFDSLHQPIRVAGSIHAKHGRQSPVRVLACRPLDHDLEDLEQRAASMPPLCGATPARTRVGPRATDLLAQCVRAGGVDGINRFDALSKVIGHWLRQARVGRASLEQAWQAVDEYNTARIDPPWAEDKLRREFDALLALDRAKHAAEWKAHGAPVAGPGHTFAAGAPPRFSEDALAAEFVALHGMEWRHVGAWGIWHVWTGTHWSRDETGLVLERVRAVCRQSAADAEAEGKATTARRIASEKTIRAVARIASSDPRVATRTSDWDGCPGLLNTPAGQIDLETGEVQPHDRASLLTQITNAEPGGECPRWLAFLDEVTAGDVDFGAYLARLCGYCLTGSTREQVFFFLHGEGANGKSVFVDTVAHILGSYAAAAPFDTFMASRQDRHSTDLAGLRARRFVSVAETEQGRAWAETRIKMVTGGDPISARFMHRDNFEYRPEFKLVVAGNHRPRLSGVGEAMRRRLQLVPFSVTVPPERRDRQLAARLKAEADGILGWMLGGLADWRDRGLDPPAAVTGAAEAYFEEEDVVGQWIEEACALDAAARTATSVLFSSWRAWAEAHGMDAGTPRSLGEALRGRGLRNFKSGNRRGWTGIALKGPAAQFDGNAA